MDLFLRFGVRMRMHNSNHRLHLILYARLFCFALLFVLFFFCLFDYSG